MAKTKPFDPASYLNTPKAAAEYLQAAIEHGDPRIIRAAVRDVIRARTRALRVKATPLSTPISAWAKEQQLSRRVVVQIRKLQTLGDLVNIRESALSGISNFGRTSRNELKEALARCGLKLRP